MSNCSKADELDRLISDSFTLQINRTPNVVYHLTNINGLGMTLNSQIIPGPQQDFITPSNKIEHNELTCDFIIDGRLSNYHEIYLWMKEIQEELNLKDMIEDMRLMLNSPNKNVIRTIIIYNAFPKNLTDLSMTYSAGTGETITASVTFAYSHWNFEDFPERDR